MQATLATRSAAAAYTHVEVTSRSPMELVVMLYDGGIAALTQARDALQRRDLVVKRTSLTKAISIISHLQSTVNMEEGRGVARQLDRLYDCSMERIATANVICSQWAGIRTGRCASSISAASLAVPATGPYPPTQLCSRASPTTRCPTSVAAPTRRSTTVVRSWPRARPSS